MDDLPDILIEIQKFDDECKSTQSKIDETPHKLAKLEKEIEQAKHALSEKQDRIADIRKNYKMKEGDIAENESKINKLNSQTFVVKTNEEYRAMISEIEFLKKKNEKTEDEMLNLLEEEETLKNSLSTIKVETDEYIKERTAKTRSLNKEKEELTEKLGQAEINFANCFNKLPNDIKNMYNKIKNVRGKAVCLIEDETCTGCSTILTPQFFNELKKRQEILLCDNCGRILIYAAINKKK